MRRCSASPRSVSWSRACATKCPTPWRRSEEYIREVIERFQDSHSETELARMLRKALWMRRRQWGLKRTRKDVSR
jgi:hypothetical protein